MSPSRYKQSLDQLLGRVLTTPDLFYARVDQLEAMFFGHETAFVDIEGVAMDQCFTWRFNDWLNKKTGWDVSRGWPQAIAAHYPSDSAARDAFVVLLRDYLQDDMCQQRPR